MAEEPKPDSLSSTQKLLLYTRALAKHIEGGRQLLKAAREELASCQNGASGMNSELSNECREILEAVGRAIDHCKNRSNNLRAKNEWRMM